MNSGGRVADTYVDAHDSRQQLAANIEATLNGDAQNWLGLFDFDSQCSAYLQMGPMVALAGGSAARVLSGSILVHEIAGLFTHLPQDESPRWHVVMAIQSRTNHIRPVVCGAHVRMVKNVGLVVVCFTTMHARRARGSRHNTTSGPARNTILLNNHESLRSTANNVAPGEPGPEASRRAASQFPISSTAYRANGIAGCSARNSSWREQPADGVHDLARLSHAQASRPRAPIDPRRTH